MATRNENSTPANSSPSSAHSAMVQAAAQLPASYPLGAPRTDDRIVLNGTDSAAQVVPAVNNGKATHSVKSSVAGICVIDYVPVLGYSKTATSALNRAVFSQFNEIRKQISGNRPYEPADHMIYRLCVDSLRELFYYGCRAYMVVAKYSAQNLYRPRAIMTAMGLDFDDWSTNAADFYQWLKQQSTALEPFPTVPLGDLTAKRLDYNTMFYTDGEGASAQTYIINQRAFYSYEVVDQVKGLTLRTLGRTVAEFIELFNTLYSALQSSSDCYIIAADIRRAFGDAVITNLQVPEAGSEVAYAKMDAALLSIMNADIWPIAAARGVTSDILKPFRVVDNGGLLTCAPTLSRVVGPGYAVSAFQIGARHYHLNMVADNPTTDDIVAGMRWKSNSVSRFLMDASDVLVNTEFSAFGTEILIGMYIVTAESSTPLAYGGITVETDAAVLDAKITALSRFDWAPAVHFALMDGSATWDGSAKLDIRDYVQDIQNYVPVYGSQIENIHNALLLETFGVGV